MFGYPSQSLATAVVIINPFCGGCYMNGDRFWLLHLPIDLCELRSYAYQWNWFFGCSLASGASLLPTVPANWV